MTEAVMESVVETLRVNIHGLSEQKLSKLLSTSIQACTCMRFIIDGLDECERDVQQAITDTLCHFSTVGTPLVNVLITCRDEGHLMIKLSKFDRLHISRQNSAADVQSYISHAIASSLSSGSMIIHDPALKEEIISKLVSKAQGMYV